MKPFAIMFRKKGKGREPEATMVILVSPERIRAFGLPGIGAIVVDGMNEDFAQLDAAGIKRTAKELKDRYDDGGTGYGSSVTFLDYATHKKTIDDAIESLVGKRVDVITKKSR